MLALDACSPYHCLRKAGKISESRVANAEGLAVTAKGPQTPNRDRRTSGFGHTACCDGGWTSPQGSGKAMIEVEDVSYCPPCGRGLASASSRGDRTPQRCRDCAGVQGAEAPRR